MEKAFSGMLRTLRIWEEVLELRGDPELRREVRGHREELEALLEEFPKLVALSELQELREELLRCKTEAASRWGDFPQGTHLRPRWKALAQDLERVVELLEVVGDAD